MKRIIIGKYKVELYDAIDEMPIVRYYEYNKYLLIDSAVGSTIEDIESNINKLMRFIGKNEKDNMLKQLMLMKQNLYFVHQKKNPEFLSFACLIYSINDKKVTDISQENLQRIINKFKYKLTPKILRDVLHSVKKKIGDEMDEYFPTLTDSVELKEFYGKMRERTLLVIKSIKENKDYDKEIAKIDEYLLDMMKPETFYGEKNKELKYQKEFEEMCFILSQNVSKEPKSMTVLEFYNAFEMLKKQKPKNVSHGRK